MDQTEEARARSSSREPTIREELEGFLRALGLMPETPQPRLGDPQRMEKTLGSGTPPVADIEVTRPKTDGKLDAAEQVGVMLKDLFESQDTFVISNAGVQAILDAAKDDPLVLDTGQEVSLVTTQKAQELLERICPRSPYLPNTRGTRNVR